MIIRSIHALIEALESDLPINKVMINNVRKDQRIERVIALCRKNKVAFQYVPQETITRKAGNDSQGIYAEIAPIPFYSLEEIINPVNTGLILILDGINDTGNMGAIIRSAVAAAVDGIIIPQRNSAPINETVLKTSAGSLVKARLTQVTNINQTILQLKKSGFWVVGTTLDPMNSIPYCDYDFTANTAIIMGSEHKGLSPLIKKNADQLIHIPHAAVIQSLNVSAATAIILFEALRQKRQTNP